MATISEIDNTQTAGECGAKNVAAPSFSDGWRTLCPYLILAALTLLCLLPFSGKAFHTDDPLFVWSAQHIVQHPLDPFGFSVAWELTEEPMWVVTKNPPLACYYSALVGSLFGWSEKTLHLAFLLPALALVLGTYRLAQRFTSLPLIAALATLLTPGFLVSSTSVMCDIMMLALWIAAMIFWLEGFDPIKPSFLVISGFFVGASALTKYFGVTLIPLLFAYSMVKRRRIEKWAWYFLIPICMLAGYEYWAHVHYGSGLISQAAGFALQHQYGQAWSNVLVALAFIGGCAISALTLGPLIWSWRWLLAGTAFGGILLLASATGWIRVPVVPDALDHLVWISFQWALLIVAGFSILALPLMEWWQRKDADPFLLMFWIGGTFLFAAFVNWTINARSVLPLIPPVSILLARRLQSLNSARQRILKISVALILAGVLSLWITWGDTALANSARIAARMIGERTRNRSGRLLFQGHSGFQYYIQELGFIPYDLQSYQVRSGDLLVVPSNNTYVSGLPRSSMVKSRQMVELDMHRGTTTLNASVGAAFYFSLWGPLPFAFGAVPAERYYLVELAPSNPEAR